MTCPGRPCLIKRVPASLQALHASLSLPLAPSSGGGKALSASERASLAAIPSLLAALLGSSLAATLLGNKHVPSIAALSATLKVAIAPLEPAGQRHTIGLREAALQLLPLLVAVASGVVAVHAGDEVSGGASGAPALGRVQPQVSFTPQR